MAKGTLTFLNDLVLAVTRLDRRGRDRSELTLQNLLLRPASERLRAACDVLMGRIGEAARVAVAEQALSAYAELDDAEREVISKGSWNRRHKVERQARSEKASTVL